MTASTHMVNANGLRFRTLVEGPPDGDMFLLMHGFPEGAESWARQLHVLAHAGFLAVAPDLRGYGLTDAPEGVENYAIDLLVADAKALIESFGRKSAHIAGHDWGAAVAGDFAGAQTAMTTTPTALSVGHPAALAAAGRAEPHPQARRARIAVRIPDGQA